jgi:hypothetical protein
MNLRIARHAVKLASTIDDIGRLTDQPQGVGAALSDFLLLPDSYRRAGRASALAESYGDEANMAVDRPKTHRLLASLGGGLAGVVGGGLLGSMLETKPGVTYLGGQSTPRETAARGGATAGGALGLLLGALYDTHRRRKGIDDVAGQAEGHAHSGEVPTSAVSRGSLLSAGSDGVFQQGRADTAENIAYGKRRFDGNPMLSLLAIGNRIPGPNLLTLPMSGVGNLSEGMEARDRISDARPSFVRNMQ